MAQLQQSMETLKHRIVKFNAELEVLDEYSAMLKIAEPANEKQLTELKKYFELKMPSSLELFYHQIGSLQNDAESYSFKITSAEELIKDINAEDKWFQLKSLGLIDFIKYRWGNDRPEFNNSDLEKITFLNNNYKCFGLFALKWGLEESYYLYFDKQQKFGWVRYHQDTFEELWAEYLNPMLTKSMAPFENLYDILVEIIDQLEDGVKQNSEE